MPFVPDVCECVPLPAVKRKRLAVDVLVVCKLMVAVDNCGCRAFRYTLFVATVLVEALIKSAVPLLKYMVLLNSILPPGSGAIILSPAAFCIGLANFKLPYIAVSPVASVNALYEIALIVNLLVFVGVMINLPVVLAVM
jgi:hypothetical protein